MTLAVHLGEFIQILYDSGLPKYFGEVLVSAISARFPHLRPTGVLEVGKRAVKTWGLAEPSEHSEYFD